ncbi:TauD/TfdA dioxygenase family protein [Stutzerimonas balearica]|uniref:TauD/TfdA dioxygenase family protein n=1 Tax=Stutzerimonas balearica TaxID=74829 RepID=UPI00190AB263|nr:TauD/TfdA family dioxygenase [Stutzerimonas balearica]MBK3748372.1 taurine dioxygenase [Stutzerimonas balearica]MBK3826569.1 taurine dioxygenase [Stutzerimonas balearica]MBK3856259.1 taurine dioxygenase [Stutzerimonas balearica]
MSTTLTIQPLGPRLGAEVLDLDPATIQSRETLTALEAALVKHETLVLHVPDLRPEQHLAIAQHFGEPEVHTFYPNLGEGFEQITVIDSKLGDRADMWHHDESFLPSPPIVTMTHAQILPPCGGDTCWISMTSAYDALSERMKQYLDGLSAWHDMNAPMTAALRQNVVSYERYLEVINGKRRHLHPLVITHPVTGRKALYLSPTYTTHIDGLAVPESDAILAYLHAHCQQVHFGFRHRWTVGDMVLWDNRSVLHNAILDYQPHQRRMHRASVFDRRATR